MLAVRNSSGAIEILTSTRHGDDEAVGQPTPVTASLIERVLDVEPLHESPSQQIQGRDSAVSMERVDVVDWVVIATTDVEDTGVVTLPAWLIPALIAIGALMLVPIALMRNRLKQLSVAAEQLGRGRLLEPLTDNSTDEIGVVSRALERIDDRLHNEEGLRSQSAAALQHRASHDPLTGLANRGRLVEELTDALDNREAVACLLYTSPSPRDRG